MDILKGREGISRGGPLSPESGHRVRTQLRLPEHHQRRSRIGSCYGNEALGILEESRSLERRHPLIPSSAPTGKVAPLRTGTVLGPRPGAETTLGLRGREAVSARKRSLPLVDRPEGAPLGAAPVSCSMLRPKCSSPPTSHPALWSRR